MSNYLIKIKSTLKHALICVFMTFPMTNLFAEANKWQGVPFPSFELADQNNTIKSNNDFKDQWVVYYFYPKDKTPGCTVEAKNFVEDFKKYGKLNTRIVGISYDSVESHKDFADTYEMKFTLLADTERKLTKALDVDSLFPWPHPSRQTFLVNNKGIIVKHYKEVDPDNHSSKLLKDLGLLQQNLTIL
ncbi:MAG: peroxiredoxin [Kangiellaceae bacterium]